MSDDWKVGDLALCIEGGIRTREGSAYTVLSIHPPGEWLHGLFNPGDELIFDFVEFGILQEGSSARRFRKIRPDEHEACEEEFRILLQLSKKRVQA
jgi:hypothetical protein